MTRRTPLADVCANELQPFHRANSESCSTASTTSLKRRRDGDDDNVSDTGYFSSIRRASTGFRSPKTRRIDSPQSPYLVPETSPSTTRQVWSDVYSMMSSNPLKKSKGAASGGESTSSRGIRPEQYNVFQQHVLGRCGITISQSTTKASTPKTHFKSAQRPTAVPGMRLVQLDITEQDVRTIAESYVFMDKQKLCEAEFATYAMETFFRVGEPAVFRHDSEENDREWHPRRMIQFRITPKDRDNWDPPPPQNDQEAPNFNWNLHPDCSYWLSMRGFNEDYQEKVSYKCFVHEMWTTCSYLTIEFKKDKNDYQEARVQAAAAGSMALYNRWRLAEMVETENPDEEWPNHESIAHYAITYMASKYDVFILRPELAKKEHGSVASRWRGCKMIKIASGDCTRASSVKELMNWVNAIHLWGLTDHADGCKDDVKRLLAEDGIDTSSFME